MIEIQGAFTKGMIDAKGRNKIPAYFAGYVRNARIRNGAITNRLGPRTRWNLGDAPLRQLHRNDGELLGISGGILHKLYPSPVQVFGTVGTATQQYTMISQGKYTIILNGTDAPRVYSRATGLFNSASPTAPSGTNAGPNTLPYANSSDPSLQNPNPLIGASITGFTIIAGSQSSNNHILYMSKPVLPETPENAYNRSMTASASGTTGQIQDQQSYDIGRNRHMTSEILGMVSNLDNVYVFCRESIEMISRNNVETFGSYYNLATIPIGDGDQLAGIHASCVAGQKVFFLTKSLHIKTIGYAEGVAYPLIGDLSDRQGQEIREFMRQNVDDDQRYAVAFFNKEQNTIEFHIRSRKSNYENDITLIYDLVHDAFLVDDNKSYSCVARGGHDGLRMYAGDFSTGQVYLDHIDSFDETTGGYQTATPFEYDTPNISLGNPAKEKQFRGFTLCGAMNANTTLVITCFIDGREEFVKTIARNDIYPTELQAIAIGGDEDSLPGQIKFHPFEYVADQGMLRKKGKRIRIKITAERIGQEFYLDALAIDADATGNFELNDKF